MGVKDATGEWAPKWVHLLDGGLTDNIGLRSILRAYDRSSGFIGQRVNAGRIKRLVFIAVNARTDPPEELSGREPSPGVLDVFMKTATVSMETLTVDALDYAVNRHEVVLGQPDAVEAKLLGPHHLLDLVPDDVGMADRWRSLEEVVGSEAHRSRI